MLARVEQLSSRVVYRNAWMTVREDEVRRDDGGCDVYGVVDKQDFALVVPQAPGGFWVVEQYRYPVGRRAVEFPQGSWGSGAGGSPSELARAELREETGLTAGTLTHLGRLTQAHGFCSQHFDVWLARDLVEGEPEREASEQDMTHRFVPDEEFRQLVATGGLADAPSLAAYALLAASGR